ncbi:MAG: chorismate mutase [Erysipelotrichaceae bacterium]|nr:chorismate mutase [Erysipelotrichaceae bacterium]
MKSLEQCRNEIDEIDQQLIQLFEKRMNVAKDVVSYKIANGLQIFQPDREKAVIEKNVARINNPQLKKYGHKFIQEMMNLSKDYQADFIPNHINLNPVFPLKHDQSLYVGFQGVDGAFSKQALETYFLKEVKVKNYDQFEDVFIALKNEEIQYGIVPIENSSTGAINDIYDLIRDYGFYIVGEENILITQNLLGLENTDINKVKEVYSHPQGLAQSSAFLNETSWKRIPYLNTAMSAKLVAQLKDPTKVAIASIKAAELYGLKVLKDNIQNDKNNHTRFIVIGKQLESMPDYDRISIVCTLKHEVGSLYKMLEIIKDYELNMVRIESRPLTQKPWEYYFYIDFDGNLKQEQVQRALEKMKQHAKTLRILGAFKAK